MKTVFVITAGKFFGLEIYVNRVLFTRYYPFMDLEDVMDYKKKLKTEMKAELCRKKS